MPTYRVRIVRRTFQQSSDDYHATVTRIEDGVELTFIRSWRWWLKWEVRPKAIVRAFAKYDNRKAKVIAAAEEYII